MASEYECFPTRLRRTRRVLFWKLRQKVYQLEIFQTRLRSKNGFPPKMFLWTHERQFGKHHSKNIRRLSEENSVFFTSCPVRCPTKKLKNPFWEQQMKLNFAHKRKQRQVDSVCTFFETLAHPIVPLHCVELSSGNTNKTWFAGKIQKVKNCYLPKLLLSSEYVGVKQQRTILKCLTQNPKKTILNVFWIETFTKNVLMTL